MTGTRVTAVLSFALLAAQASMPWLGSHFLTQDGPSHVYTALVARSLLFDPQSIYSKIYALQQGVVTNWSTTVLLNLLALLFGVDRAEKALATLCIVAGYFAFAWLARSLQPEGRPWTPVFNFLLTTWFLSIGFYNFHLGIVVMAWLAGYYIRHVRELNGRRALVLGSGMVLLFFTHVLPLGLLLLVTGMVWACSSRTLRAAAWTTAAALPTLLLCGIFLRKAAAATVFEPHIAWAWNNFPMHVFAGSRGRTGEQYFLVPAMLFYLAAGMLAMRRAEWRSARTAVFGAAALSFVLYLLLPNSGFGGDEIKIRLSWAVFVFGCIAASTVERIRAIALPVSVYVTAFLSVTLIHTYRHNVANLSDAVWQYTEPLERIPEGATFLRVRFPAEQTRVRLGIDPLASEPFFHADALVAAKRRLVALTDYQALTNVFPVTLRKELPPELRPRLWDLEGTGPNAVTSARALLEQSPVPFDYVVLLGDGTPDETAGAYLTVRRELESRMQCIGEDVAGGFVRVYRRRPPVQ